MEPLFKIGDKVQLKNGIGPKMMFVGLVEAIGPQAFGMQGGGSYRYYCMWWNANTQVFAQWYFHEELLEDYNPQK